MVANYARELGVMVWESAVLRKMYVTIEGHTQVRSVDHLSAEEDGS